MVLYYYEKGGLRPSKRGTMKRIFMLSSYSLFGQGVEGLLHSVVST